VLQDKVNQRLRRRAGGGRAAIRAVWAGIAGCRIVNGGATRAACSD